MTGRPTAAEMLSFAEDDGASEIAAITEMCRAAGCETSLKERERMAEERISVRSQQRILAARCATDGMSKADYIEAIEGLGDRFLAVNRMILGESRFRSVFGDASGAGLVDRTVFLGEATGTTEQPGRPALSRRSPERSFDARHRATRSSDRIESK